VFLCLRDDGAIIHYGTAADLVSATVDWHCGIHKVAVCVAVADPQLGELTRSAAYRVLMALGACSGVEHRTESAVHIVRALIDLLIELKSVARRLGNSVAREIRTMAGLRIMSLSLSGVFPRRVPRATSFVRTVERACAFVRSVVVSVSVLVTVVSSVNPGQEVVDDKVGHCAAEPFAGILI
jgi:hypothetical protein